MPLEQAAGSICQVQRRRTAASKCGAVHHAAVGTGRYHWRWIGQSRCSSSHLDNLDCIKPYLRIARTRSTRVPAPSPHDRQFRANPPGGRGVRGDTDEARSGRRQVMSETLLSTSECRTLLSGPRVTCTPRKNRQYGDFLADWLEQGLQGDVRVFVDCWSAGRRSGRPPSVRRKVNSRVPRLRLCPIRSARARRMATHCSRHLVVVQNCVTNAQNIGQSPDPWRQCAFCVSRRRCRPLRPHAPQQPHRPSRPSRAPTCAPSPPTHARCASYPVPPLHK